MISGRTNDRRNESAKRSKEPLLSSLYRRYLDQFDQIRIVMTQSFMNATFRVDPTGDIFELQVDGNQAINDVINQVLVPALIVSDHGEILECKYGIKCEWDSFVSE